MNFLNANSNEFSDNIFADADFSIETREAIAA